MERLKIHKIKNVMYAYIEFWSIPDNKYLPMSVLIDTGASMTTLSQTTARRLGYNLGEVCDNIRTAGGFTSSNEIIIPKMKLNKLEFTDVQAHAIKFLDDYEIDGILGMNILGQFRITIDPVYNLITLEMC